MNNPTCDICGGKTKKNGHTSSGKVRYRCTVCGASSIKKNDSSAKALQSFLKWLLSKNSIAELDISRASFWRHFARFWEIWPIAPYTGEVHDVVFLDGIWIGGVVVLIASAEKHVLTWHLARSESSQSWATLMHKIPEPVCAVSDGSSGFAKAARAIWPNTRIQRCTFHVFESIKRCTTTRPNLDCGKEIYALAKSLMKVADTDLAAAWIADFASWCSRWDTFLKEYTLVDGKRQYTHERLRKARRILDRLLKEGTLFTYISLQEELGGVWPAMNNEIEGGVNAQIRKVLRSHSGMPKMHCIKAAFWWCYMHTEAPLSPAEILKVMPTDDDIDGLFANTETIDKEDRRPTERGLGIDWNEFHMPTEFRQ